MTSPADATNPISTPHVPPSNIVETGMNALRRWFENAEFKRYSQQIKAVGEKVASSTGNATFTASILGLSMSSLNSKNFFGSMIGNGLTLGCLRWTVSMLNQSSWMSSHGLSANTGVAVVAMSVTTMIFRTRILTVSATALMGGAAGLAFVRKEQSLPTEVFVTSIMVGYVFGLIKRFFDSAE